MLDKLILFCFSFFKIVFSLREAADVNVLTKILAPGEMPEIMPPDSPGAQLRRTKA